MFSRRRTGSMGDGPDAKKKQLGRILLQQKVVSADELDGLLNEQLSHPGERIATALARMGRPPGDVLRALSEQHGVPGIDLLRVSLPLEQLFLVPKDVAVEHVVLPLLSSEDTLFMAMADPDNRRIIDEIEFVTGKQVNPYVAIHGTLCRVIEQAYAAAETGQDVYVPPANLAPSSSGPRSRPPPMLSPSDALAPGTPGVVSATAGDRSDAFQGAYERGVRDSLALDPQPILEAPELDPAFELSRPKRSPSSPPPKGRRVLLVDDSDDIRRLLARVLKEKGYEPYESSNGADALQQVRENTPDVLLLDAMLPEIHGFDICRRIKGSRRFGHVPIIMVSAIYRGWRFAEDLKRSYGVDHFLEKPFRMGDVLAAVEACLTGEGADSGAADEVEGEAGEALNSGIEAYANGDIEVAVGHLKRGIGLEPMAFRLHYHLGLLYGKQENLFEAIQTLETAADLRPRDFSTLKNLAVLYQRAGFRLKATEMWERAMGSCPDDDTRANIRKHLMSLL